MASSTARAGKAGQLTVALLYLAGVVQGLALVTFPAASAIFTDPHGYHLSGAAYGYLFVPQVVAAIAASAGVPRLTRKFGLRGVLLLGLAADLASMLLLALSPTLTGSPLVYPLLLTATAALGLGFGATVPSLNTAVEFVFPARADAAVLALNALLGLGTALAPVLVALCNAFGAWWMLPAIMAAISALFIAALARLPPLGAEAAEGSAASARPPRRFWFYCLAAVLYGVVETLAGNWSVLFLSSERHLAAGTATFALTAFWSATTLGRILFAVLNRVLSARWVYAGLPLLLALVYELVPNLEGVTAGIAGFALAGLACSALLPLSISLGSAEFPRRAATMSGALIAFYQVGYGIAAFGVGPLHDAAGFSYASLYRLGGGVALALALVAGFLAWRAIPEKS